MAEILHQLIWIISHYLQGFKHPRWCRISSINSRKPMKINSKIIPRSHLTGKSLCQYYGNVMGYLPWKSQTLHVWYIFCLPLPPKKQSKCSILVGSHPITDPSKKGLLFIYQFTYPKAPDPSYGNTRPSKRDTPKRASKQVATWHPMTSQGVLGYNKTSTIHGSVKTKTILQWDVSWA